MERMSFSYRAAAPGDRLLVSTLEWDEAAGEDGFGEKQLPTARFCDSSALCILKSRWKLTCGKGAFLNHNGFGG